MGMQNNAVFFLEMSFCLSLYLLFSLSLFLSIFSISLFFLFFSLSLFSLPLSFFHFYFPFRLSPFPSPSLVCAGVFAPVRVLSRISNPMSAFARRPFTPARVCVRAFACEAGSPRGSRKSRRHSKSVLAASGQRAPAGGSSPQRGRL